MRSVRTFQIIFVEVLLSWTLLMINTDRKVLKIGQKWVLTEGVRTTTETEEFTSYESLHNVNSTNSPITSETEAALPNKVERTTTRTTLTIPTTIETKTTMKTPESVAANLGIFMNVWIPGEDRHVGKGWERSEKVSLDIVSEQLDQISNSYAATQNLTVYMTIIGKDAVNQTRLDNLCGNVSKNLKCIFSQFQKKGGELDTLSDLHQFCSKIPNSDEAAATTKVLYLHNKGSFHPDTKNTRWRRAMTDAITTKMCLKPQDDQCNVCGLQFSMPPKMFTLLFPGNFFAASCEYIQQLHDPMDFKKRMHDMILQAKKKNAKKIFHFLRKGDRDWVLGANRYTPEHWIGSHPSIQPCDVSSAEEYWYWQQHDHTPNEFNWSMAPRRFNSTTLDSNIPEKADLRLKTYILLPGLLWRFRHMYNATPAENSWLYDHLPDGMFWKKMVQQHGLDAVNTVTAGNFDREKALTQMS